MHSSGNEALMPNNVCFGADKSSVSVLFLVIFSLGSVILTLALLGPLLQEGNF